MADLILVDGDVVNFLPAFGAAVVVVQPGKLAGSGPATIGGKNICVDGDETKVSVPGCVYMTPQYSIPGTGTLKIAQLAGNRPVCAGELRGDSGTTIGKRTVRPHARLVHGCQNG